MDETLEVERCREIEGELRSLGLKARFYGGITQGLLLISSFILLALERDELYKFAWLFLCVGLAFGFVWIIYVVEANRAKVELSLHLAKCQLLAQGQILAKGIH